MQNKNKIRIDIINRYFYPVLAGIEISLLNTAKNWVDKADITVHTSKNTLDKKDILKNDDVIEGMKIERYKFGLFGFFPDIPWSKTDLVILQNFDVFPHFQILLFCSILKLLGRKKFNVKLSFHGGFTPDWSTFPIAQRIIKKTYHETFGTFLINFVVDGVHAISKWEEKEIIKYGVRRNLIKTIPNGIEEESQKNAEKYVDLKFKSKVKGFGKYIIQVGRIHPIKNYETTIRALRKVNPKVNYLIVGPTQVQKYMKNLEHLVKKLGLEKRVIFAGEISGFEKYYLLKHAQMMVHMALWESYCNVVHEGLSQGLICIVSKNTALPYLVKDGINGFCVDTKNYNALSDKINYVLRNKKSKALKEMQSNNRKVFKERTWKAVSEELFEFYTQNQRNYI